MIAFEAILLPDNSLQILKPLLRFTRPRRVIITILDEEMDMANEPLVPAALPIEQNAHGEAGAWLPFSTRIPNLHAGLVQMSDDFDVPLPDSFWLGEAEEEKTEATVA